MRHRTWRHYAMPLAVYEPKPPPPRDIRLLDHYNPPVVVDRRTSGALLAAPPPRSPNLEEQPLNIEAVSTLYTQPAQHTYGIYHHHHEMKPQEPPSVAKSLPADEPSRTSRFEIERDSERTGESERCGSVIKQCLSSSLSIHELIEYRIALHRGSLLRDCATRSLFLSFSLALIHSFAHRLAASHTLACIL